MTEDQRAERMYEIEYSTDSREELAERIVALEDACMRALRCIRHGDCDACSELLAGCTLRTMMRELGMEVDA